MKYECPHKSTARYCVDCGQRVAEAARSTAEALRLPADRSVLIERSFEAPDNATTVPPTTEVPGEADVAAAKLDEERESILEEYK